MVQRGCKFSVPRTRHRFSLHKHRVLAALLHVLFLVSGCADDGPAPEATFAGTFAALQADIFALHCALGPCHSAGTQAGGLVLEGPVAYDQLVGFAPNNEVARAAGWLRVVPGELARSFLWIKLTNPGPGQGSRMPLGAPALGPEQLQRIEQWILAGAPRGEVPGSLGSPTPTPTPVVVTSR